MDGDNPLIIDSGRETIIKLAYWISIADGQYDKSEEKLLVKLAKHFQISNAHLKGIMSEVDETVSGWDWRSLVGVNIERCAWNPIK